MKSWFKHDYAARNDDKVLELRAEHGWEGYGIFWAIIEYMAETGGGLDSRKLGAVAIGIGVDRQKFIEIVNFCKRNDLFSMSGKTIRSRRLDAHLLEIEAKRKGGEEGGKKSAKKRADSRTPSRIPSTTPSRIPSRNASTDEIDKIDERESRAPAREERSLGDASLLEDPEVAEIADDITANALDFPEALRSWVAHLAGSGRAPSKSKLLTDLRKLRLIDDPVAAINYSIEGPYFKIFDDFDADPPERETAARGSARHEPPPPYHRLITFDKAGNPVGA
jgi:hypothetical protein